MIGMPAKVVIREDLLDMIFEGARRLYPKESIVLLRGKVNKDVITISDVIIPPLATHGTGFSSFAAHMLPMDLSIVGVAHSHPSGNLKPSVEDQNLSMGRIMVIVGYPYRGVECVAFYGRNGEKLALEVV